MGLLKQAVIVLLVAFLTTILPRYFERKLPPVSGGYVHPDFKRVQELFRKNIESGAEKGGSFAVFYKGEPLVDLWGGYADKQSERPWSKDTQSILFSATKGVDAILVAKFVDHIVMTNSWAQGTVYMYSQASITWKPITFQSETVYSLNVYSLKQHCNYHTQYRGLLKGTGIVYLNEKTQVEFANMRDRGLLDYKKLVSHYWPKFAQNGKDNITLELLVSHQAGLSITNGTIPLSWMLDEPAKVDEFIERQKPLWPPGTGHAYHALTFGLYLDRLLSKVDPKKRPASQIFREEIAIPFDIDMYNGMPLTETYRTTRFYECPLPQSLLDIISNNRYIRLLMRQFDPEDMLMKSIKSGFNLNGNFGLLNNPETKQYPGGAFNGHGNARSLAKLYGIIANGGEYKGKKLMSKKTVQLLNTPLEGPGPKNCLDGALAGMDMGLGVCFLPYGKSPKIFGTPGYGGQIGFSDVQNQLGLGYVTNHFTTFSLGDSPNFLGYQEVFYECFEKFKKKQ